MNGTRAARAAIGLAGVLALLGCTASEPDQEPSGAESSSAAAEDGGGQSDSEEDGAPPATYHSYVSQPDLTPPRISISKGPAAEEGAAEDEYIFLSPNSSGGSPLTGRMILDLSGEPVWAQPSGEESEGSPEFGFRPQQYQDEPVLTWYVGPAISGHGAGSYRMVDSNYEEISTITTGGDLGEGKADMHDSTITPDGTILLTSYPKKQADLSEIGGPEEGWVYEGVVQEVDIDSGEVLFEWHSLDHVPVEQTEADFEAAQEDAEENDKEAGTEESPFDYFHINSVSLDEDGSLLVSARNTHAVYQIDHESGEVNWVLGGKASDFEFGQDADFHWQHDAERQDDGTLTLFDNEASPEVRDHSRGLRLDLNMDTMTAEVVTEYIAPRKRLAGAMGSFQELENGNVLIGWGTEPYFSEFTKDGELIYDAWIRARNNYRAYRGEWHGTPTTDPAVVYKPDEPTPAVYVSWNGATEVEQWRLLAGEDKDNMSEVTTVTSTGFETAIQAPGDPGAMTVEALDENGEVIGSAPVEIKKE